MKWLFVLAISISTCLGQVSFTLSGGELTALSYNGTSWRTFPDPLGYPFINYTADGVDSGFRTAFPKTNTANKLTHTFRAGTSYELVAESTFTAGQDTLTVDIVIRNNSIGLLTLMDYSMFTLRSPSASMNPASPTTFAAIQADMDQPYGYFYGANWALSAWTPNYSTWPQLVSAQQAPGQRNYNWRLSLPAQNTPGTKPFNVPAGGTWSTTLVFKFSDTQSSEQVMTTDAVAAYRTSFPYLQNYPDRRAWAEWYTADHTSSTSSNPRGYWLDGSLDASNPTAFQAAMQAKLNGLLSTMNSLNPKPQGVIIWDIEGQEFQHAMTYIGDPSIMPIISPEMNAVADSIVSQIKAAGYKVGFTLRPMKILTGTTLPPTCAASPKDVFIDTDAAYPNRGYRCDSTNTWTQVALIDQTALTTVNEVLSNMRTKLEYAINRWGASAFYVDSTVNAGGGQMTTEIWRTLQAEYPSVAVFPENDRFTTLASAAPFNQARFSLWGPDTSQRLLYPLGYGFVNVQDWNGSTGYLTMLHGVAQGDMISYNGWYGNSSQTIAAGLNNAAAALNATVAMTDRGQSRTFQSAPGTSFTYPVTARVYFADTANNLAVSTTYCTRRATDSCYLNGVLQSTASLDLSTTPYWQLRYYDFAGNLVSNPGNYGTIN